MHAVVVICTRNRPDHVAAALGCVLAARADATVLVWDASDDDATAAVCARVANAQSAAVIEHVRALRKGLPMQRNDAMLHCSRMDVDVIHFLDDDTEVEAGYFDALEREFAMDDALAGAGGVFTNPVDIRMQLLKRAFLLDGGRPGTVFRSGRPVQGQSVGRLAADQTAWLVGASMSWRLDAVRSHRFNETLAGRALSEDLQFSYAVSRTAPVRVVHAARCRHEQRGILGEDQRRLAKERFLIFHSWVGDNSDSGLSLAAFWWSVIGELLLYGLAGLVPGERPLRRRALGVVDGIIELAHPRRERASRRAAASQGWSD
jgi:glycosyltransferase involved in cell wall biosynthesis